MSRWRKVLLLLFLGAVVGLVYSVTDPGLRWHQSRVDRNPQARFARWTQWTIQRVYWARAHPLEAANTLHRYCEHYPDDDRAPQAIFRMAGFYGDAGYLGTAIEVYQFLEKRHAGSDWERKAAEERDKIVARAQDRSTHQHVPAERRPAAWLRFDR